MLFMQYPKAKVTHIAKAILFLNLYFKFKFTYTPVLVLEYNDCTLNLVQLTGLVEVTSRYFLTGRCHFVKKMSVKWVKPVTPNLLCYPRL